MWRGGEAGEKGRIGEEGKELSLQMKTDLVDKLEYLLLVVCPHPVFKQAVVCKEGCQILTNLRHLANFKSSRGLCFPVEFPETSCGHSGL